MFRFDNHAMNADPMFHVDDHKTVRLIGPLQHGNLNTRFVYAKANMIEDRFNFGHWFKQEDLIIELMTKFVMDESTTDLLKKVSSVVAVSEKQVDDDGVSQVVEIRQGLRLKGKVKIENPVTLRPWRTFREIEQPASDFIVRLDGKRNRDGEVYININEADGAKWKLDAIEGIRNYLHDKMNGVTLGIIS